MFQYFLKVVSTQYRTLEGQTVNSHQYSVTHFERDLTTGAAGNTNEGVQIQHGIAGVPGKLYCRRLEYSAISDHRTGTLFNYEISPILVAHRETRQSFAHFLTSYVFFCVRSTQTFPDLKLRTCAIVGGVLTVASILDSALFATQRSFKKNAGPNGQANGKLM